MDKKLAYIVLAIMAVLIVSLACGGSTPEVNAPAQGEDQPAAAEGEATSAPVGSSRSNPAPPGAEVTIDDMTFVVLDAVRPADDIVAQGNMFNTEPEDGQEYIMVNISVKCEKTEDETCNIGPFLDLSLIGSSGVARDSEWSVSGVDGQLESTEFFGGATTSGSLFFIVEKDETDLVLRYEDILGMSTAFMALP